MKYYIEKEDAEIGWINPREWKMDLPKQLENQFIKQKKGAIYTSGGQKNGAFFTTIDVVKPKIDPKKYIYAVLESSLNLGLFTISRVV